MSDRENRIGWRFGPAPYELYLKEPAERSMLMRAGTLIVLTKLEMRLLVLIVMLGGKTATKDQQIEIVWDGEPVDDGALSVAANRLKDKLADPVIETVWGIGQRLTCPVEPLDSTGELRARYLTALFTDADRERQTMQDAEWDRKYATEIDNIREALAWAMAERGRRFFAIDLFGATGRLFERLSLLPEARGNADRILPLIDSDIPAASALRFFTYAGNLWREADRLRALSLFQRASAFCDKLKDGDTLATLLGMIGGTRVYLGQHDEAEEDLEEAVKKLSKTDRKKDLWNALNDLGSLFAIKNNSDRAKDCFDRAIDIAGSYNDFLRKYLTVVNLGEMEFNEGAPDRAILRYKEAERGLESAPNTYRLRPLVNLAMCYVVQGDLRNARMSALKALALSSDGDGYWRWLNWLALAFLAAHHGEPAYAAQLLGAIKQLFARSGEAWQKLQQQLYDRLMRILQENLSAESLGVWLVEGGRWDEARAMAFVESHILPAIPAETADNEAK
ncbi:MAG: helix-turn-helix domain-containing protein [Aliidongia sp.]